MRYYLTDSIFSMNATCAKLASFREEIYKNEKVALDLYPSGSTGRFDIFVTYSWSQRAPLQLFWIVHKSKIVNVNFWYADWELDSFKHFLKIIDVFIFFNNF
jgi:hypothetical protein